MLENAKKMFRLASGFFWKNGGLAATLFKDIHVLLLALQRKFLNIYRREKNEKYISEKYDAHVLCRIQFVRISYCFLYK